MGWIIDVQGVTLRESEVQAAHVSVANAAIGSNGWDILDPMSSPQALIVWCALCVSKATNRPLDESLVFVQAMPIMEVIECFHADEAEWSPPVQPDVDPADLSTQRLARQAQQQRFIAAATKAASQG